MADELVFDAYFGDEVKQVEISIPEGMGDIFYLIHVGGYYKGWIRINPFTKDWQWTLSGWHTGDDVFVLIDIIERNFDESGLKIKT